MRQVYHEAHVTFKKVQFNPRAGVNSLKPSMVAKRQREADKLLERFQFAKDYGLYVIFVDEVKF